MDDDTADSNATTPTAADAGTDRQLDLVWRRHRQWSLAANASEGTVGSVAVVESAAARARRTSGSYGRPDLVGLRRRYRVRDLRGGRALALAGFIQAKALKTDQTARWTRACAASEALKAEVYRYLIRVSPYAGVDRAQALLAQLDLVQARAQAQLVDQQTTSADDWPAPSVHTFDEYVTERAQNQANWHRMKATNTRVKLGPCASGSSSQQASASFCPPSPASFPRGGCPPGRRPPPQSRPHSARIWPQPNTSASQRPTPPPPTISSGSSQRSTATRRHPNSRRSSSLMSSDYSSHRTEVDGPD